jgi:hypothetical protein
MSVDTLTYAKKFEAAGVDRKQAEAHAEALREAVQDSLATKPDLDAGVSKLETAMLRHSLGVAVAIIAIVGLMLRMLR